MNTKIAATSNTFYPQKVLYSFFRNADPKNFCVPFWYARYPFNPQNIVAVVLWVSFHLITRILLITALIIPVIVI